MQADLHVVLHRQVVEQPDILEGAGDAHSVDLGGGLTRGVQPVQQDSAPGGLIDLGEQVKHCGLACAVWPDKSSDLRAANGQVEVVHRLQAAEIDAQMAAL